MSDARIPINASVRHVHLSLQHVEALFGAGHALQKKSELSQPGQFACQETVRLVGPKGAIDRVRVLGPARPETQVEISRTDEVALGIDAPLRGSGELEGSVGLLMEGPAGSVTLGRGVIQAKRHIHMSPDDAGRLGVRDKDWVMVRVAGERGLIFDDVLVRVHRDYRLDMHVDTDEANAAALGPGSYGVLLTGATLVAPAPND